MRKLLPSPCKAFDNAHRDWVMDIGRKSWEMSSLPQGFHSQPCHQMEQSGSRRLRSPKASPAEMSSPVPRRDHRTLLRGMEAMTFLKSGQRAHGGVGSNCSQSLWLGGTDKARRQEGSSLPKRRAHPPILSLSLSLMGKLPVLLLPAFSYVSAERLQVVYHYFPL